MTPYKVQDQSWYTISFADFTVSNKIRHPWLYMVPLQDTPYHVKYVTYHLRYSTRVIIQQSLWILLYHPRYSTLFHQGIMPHFFWEFCKWHKVRSPGSLIMYVWCIHQHISAAIPDVLCKVQPLNSAWCQLEILLFFSGQYLQQYYVPSEAAIEAPM